MLIPLMIWSTHLFLTKSKLLQLFTRKSFHSLWKDLLDWLNEAEKVLDADTSTSNDPAKIKVQITKHKEFQRNLGAKQPVYDTINRTARSLKDRCPKDDVPLIQQMLGELKNRWNVVCGKSVSRQRNLEEALLFSGQFNEALQALLDWLSKAEPGLSEEQPVHGDVETVNNLIDAHKAFQHELGARSNTVQFVRKAAKELIEKSEEDTTHQQAQLIELTTLWDRICTLSVNKQERLEQAQTMADDFHKKAQSLLDWLAEAERQLRYQGSFPDDETSLLKQKEEHKKFEENLLRKESHLREALAIGQEIVTRCHPDSLSSLKQWLSVLRARWEELTSWCKQRGNRLNDGLQTVRQNAALLESLLKWLSNTENMLMDQDQIRIPEDITVVQQLIQQHQDLRTDISSKQPEVDKLTKMDKRRSSTTAADTSHIPVYRKTRKSISNIRDCGRRTPEPQFKNPRVGALFNKWRQVWLLAMERQRKLEDALEYLNEVEKMKHFDFNDWRSRYLQWMHHNKSRIMDFFRRQDRDHDGKVSRKEFIDGIISSKFPTTKLEMEAVANKFDRDNDGYIDYKEFVAALRPDRDSGKPATDSERIQDEVKKQVSKCTCVTQFRIHKIGEGKYRFGDSQKLRLVRILRSTVMVRVGGGWVALDEFLVKNDPCRAKGRTNMELREQFILAQGVSQSMTGFITKSPSGSVYSGSSTYSGTASLSGRSASSASGHVGKCRAHYPNQYRQRVRSSPDIEVRRIMSRTDPNSRTPRYGKATTTSRSSIRSPVSVGSPVSTTSRCSSTGSRPPSRTGSDISESSEPEVYTTVRTETRNLGGRKQTTMTYQTHVVQGRSAAHSSSPSTSSSRLGSKIPKLRKK